MSSANARRSFAYSAWGSAAVKEALPAAARMGERTPFVQQQGNQQATQPSVAIEERVDGLELDMGQRRLE